MNGVVVVGAGLAGSRCAEAIRAGGCELPVTIVGAGVRRTLRAAGLSKEFLAGTRSRRISSSAPRAPGESAASTSG